jgi:hypothetical protein
MRVAFVFSDKALTQFMRHVDLFEPFKVLVKNSHAILTVDAWGVEQTEAIRKTCEASNYGLVACYSIDHIYWIDPAIKVVSTGTNWALVEDYVRYYQQDLALDNDKNSAWHVGLPNE